MHNCLETSTFNAFWLFVHTKTIKKADVFIKRPQRWGLFKMEVNGYVIIKCKYKGLRMR